MIYLGQTGDAHGYFIDKVGPGLVKSPLKSKAGLAKLGVTSLTEQ